MVLSNPNMKKNGNCNYCGKFGHYAYECRKRSIMNPKITRMKVIL